MSLKSIRLSVLLSAASENLRSIKTAEKELVRMKDSYRKKKIEIKKRIKSGATTGDQLINLVILVDGGVDPDIIERFRQFEARLAGKKGELVALHYTVEYCKKHSFAGDSTYAKVNVIRLAILTCENLSLDLDTDGEVLFPSTHYITHLLDPTIHLLKPDARRTHACQNDHLFSRKPIGVYDPPYNLRLVRFIVPHLTADSLSEKLYIGNEEVRDFFEKQHYRNIDALLDNFREDLGQPVLRSESDE